MRRRSLIVCGPADGFRAFRLPAVEEVADDTLAISSSDLILADGAVVLLFSRPPPTAASPRALRVGVYKQVYEKTHKRPGHSFGAVFEFFGDMPDPKKILDVLQELLVGVENLCVSQNRRFCGLPEFTDILQNKMAQSVGLILNEFDQPASVQPAAIGATTAVQATYGCKVDGSVFGEESIRLLSWYGTDPASAQCSRLVIYSSGRAEVGALLKSLPPLKQLTNEEIHRLHDEMLRSRQIAGDAAEAQLALARERDALRVENDRLARELTSLKNEFIKESIGQGEPSQQSQQPQQSKLNLSEHDLTRLRDLLLQALVAADSRAKQLKLDARVRPDAISRHDSSFLNAIPGSWLLVAACAIGVLILGILIIGGSSVDDDAGTQQAVPALVAPRDDSSDHAASRDDVTSRDEAAPEEDPAAADGAAVHDDAISHLDRSADISRRPHR